jgi:hypothetical protein
MRRRQQENTMFMQEQNTDSIGINITYWTKNCIDSV